MTDTEKKIAEIREGLEKATLGPQEIIYGYEGVNGQWMVGI